MNLASLTTLTNSAPLSVSTNRDAFFGSHGDSRSAEKPSESGVGGRHHVAEVQRTVALPGHGGGSPQPTSPGLSVGRENSAKVKVLALTHALGFRRPASGTVFYGDRDVEFPGVRFKHGLLRAGIAQGDGPPPPGG